MLIQKKIKPSVSHPRFWLFGFTVSVGLFCGACQSVQRNTNDYYINTTGGGLEVWDATSSRLDKINSILADSLSDPSVEGVSALLAEKAFLRNRELELQLYSVPGSFSLEKKSRIFERQYGEYLKIAGSEWVGPETKRDVWLWLCQRWDLEPGEAPARLSWDAELQKPVMEIPPSVRILSNEGAVVKIEPAGLVTPSFDQHALLVENEVYVIEIAKKGFAAKVMTFPADWTGAKEMQIQLEPLKIVHLDESTTMSFARLDAGRFMMGYVGKQEDERPVHEVFISHGFWMGVSEVTQEQYESVMKVNPSRFVGAKLPVHNVSWTDARGFCVRLTERERLAGRLPEGYVYRLPTEAEWEYACRAGTGQAFGADAQAMTWHAGNAGSRPRPVATRLPNPWGLYDMHGNVLEWCLDGHSEYPEENQIDPLRGVHEKIKITRGGAWTQPLKFCRSSHRHSWLFGLNMADIGLRVVLAPELENLD